MTKILAALALALAAVTPAHAWGDREQGILAGIAGTLIWQHIQQGHAQPLPVPPVVTGFPQQYPQTLPMPQPQVYPQHYPQQPRVIVVPQPQVIVIPSGHGHRHYNNGYYQLPDPRVYRPQQY